MVFRVVYRDKNGGAQACIALATDLADAIAKATPWIQAKDKANTVIGVEQVCTIDVQ